MTAQKTADQKPDVSFHRLIDEFVVEREIPAELRASFPNIRDIQYYHPGLKRFWNSEKPALTANSTFATDGQIVSWEPTDDKNIGIGTIRYADGRTDTRKVYAKTIHLLDPFMYLDGEYDEPPLELPAAHVSHNSRKKKLLDPNNQAYIDVTTMTILSRLNEVGVTPHTMRIYGAICGVQDSYKYNITDEFETLRNRTWFWRSIGPSGELLHVEAVEEGVGEDFIAAIRKCPLDLTEDAASAVSAAESMEIEELDVGDVAEATEAAAEEVAELEEATLDFDTVSETVQLKARKGSDASITSSAYDNVHITVECKNMPVIVLFEEVADGTMEDLLGEDIDMEESLLRDDSSSVEDALAIMDAEKEERWTAWLMQVICALVQMQALLFLCHNDLHTNNIVWTDTAYEYIHYEGADGQIWSVPTYGKLFHIIDFGRATLKVGNKEFMSDDFYEGNEAAGQYNYGACYDDECSEVAANPSFDLCRLAVSLLDSLYAETPEVRSGKKKKVLSAEDDWIKYTTVSPLYNTIWRWLVDDDGENVLRDEEGEDKYPGFDLYAHIASAVHGAVPVEQLEVAPFNSFKVSAAIAKKELGALKVRLFA